MRELCAQVKLWRGRGGVREGVGGAQRIGDMGGAHEEKAERERKTHEPGLAHALTNMGGVESGEGRDKKRLSLVVRGTSGPCGRSLLKHTQRGWGRV